MTHRRAVTLLVFGLVVALAWASTWVRSSAADKGESAFPDVDVVTYASGLTGFYLAVTREGEVGAGDEIKAIARDPNGVPVSEITRLYIAKRYGGDEVSSVQRTLRVAALPESWKSYFQEQLRKVG